MSLNQTIERLDQPPYVIRLRCSQCQTVQVRRIYAANRKHPVIRVSCPCGHRARVASMLLAQELNSWRTLS